jgi:hypothetical protein
MSLDSAISISLEVSLNIFSSPPIKQTADELLNEMKPYIIGKAKDQTIRMCRYYPNFDVHEEKVYKYFLTIFFKDILSDALTACLKGENDYNMVDCIKLLLTKENMKKAAEGKCFIDAYSKAVNELPE